jgi:hypothetical protein
VSASTREFGSVPNQLMLLNEFVTGAIQDMNKRKENKETSCVNDEAG